MRKVKKQCGCASETHPQLTAAKRDLLISNRDLGIDLLNLPGWVRETFYASVSVSTFALSVCVRTREKKVRARTCE